MRHDLRQRRGFTLIEVLVVVAIIAVLITVLLASLQRARSQAKTAWCLSNLRQIGSGMVLYREANKGWFPVSQVERWLYRDRFYSGFYHEPQPEGWPYPIENCHWGGKRATYEHRWDWQGVPPVPETQKRPLTKYLWGNASLDARTPLFECPADVGVPAYFAQANPDAAPLGPNQPYYEVCGNSYRINPWIPPWGDLIGVPRERVRTAAEIILVQDASLDNGIWRFTEPRPPSWHSTGLKHNVMFLDVHAELKSIDTMKHHGPGWYIVNYFELIRYQY